MPEGTTDESEDTGLPDEQEEDDCNPQDLLRMRQEDLE